MSQSELDRQVGGNHYKGIKYQVMHWAEFNGLSFIEGNIIKYITRWRKKDGMRDVDKAIHYYKTLVELVKSGEMPSRPIGVPLWKLPEFFQQFPELRQSERNIIMVVTMWRRDSRYDLGTLDALFTDMREYAVDFLGGTPHV